MAIVNTTVSASRRAPVPTPWDLIALALVVSLLTLVAHGAREMNAPLAGATAQAISLDPIHLPEYALRTVLRMLAGLVVSLVFTFTYATLAAKSRRAEWLLIPLLDILQSVPVLGFLTFTVTGFMALFPGRVLGAECAAIFAVFTAQAWNMAFSFYQSLKTLPEDLEEVCASFRFNGWQRFWRLEVPYAMPGLIWNTMMSMSGAWFFVVIPESISVGNTSIVLPGIGSYLAQAIASRSITAVIWVIIAMAVVIAVYDQLLFRPLVAWSDKFRFEQTAGAPAAHSWVLRILQRARAIDLLMAPLAKLAELSFRLAGPASSVKSERRPASLRRALDLVWLAVIVVGVGGGLVLAVRDFGTTLSWPDLRVVVIDGAITLTRVIVLIIVATLIWVPLGVWIGLRPQLAAAIQPAVQFLAAFPANLLFPIAVVAIVHFHLSPDIWLSPLMILGTQWYILFNVVAGTTAFPNDLKEASASLHMRGWLWWRTAALPAVFPYYVTGALTASGGSWNASIVAEVVQWGDTKLQARGLGSYIANATEAGDHARVMLGIVTMSLFVTLFNRLLWRPLYAIAQRRFRLA